MPPQGDPGGEEGREALRQGARPAQPTKQGLTNGCALECGVGFSPIVLQKSKIE